MTKRSSKRRRESEEDHVNASQAWRHLVRAELRGSAPVSSVVSSCLRRNLVDLPTAILQQVALHLPAYSVAALCCTCMTAHAKLTTKANRLWWKIVPQRFTSHPERARYQQSTTAVSRGWIRKDQYDDRVNYKQEILGRIRRHPLRCVICLGRLHPRVAARSIKIPEGCPQKIFNMGYWCDTCLSEAVSYMTHETKEWLQEHGGDPSERLFDYAGKRLAIRVMLISFATKIWDGMSPVNLGYKYALSNAIIKAREKWAPTQKLHTFLFCPGKLHTDRTRHNRCPCNSAEHAYYHDPTEQLLSLKDFEAARDKRNLVRNVKIMLERLIWYQNPRYFDPKSQLGGTFAPWISAAKKWHWRALMTECNFGHTLSLEHIVDPLNQGPMKALRCSLGLPSMPDSSEFVSDWKTARARNILIKSCSWAMNKDNRIVQFTLISKHPEGLEGYLDFCLRHDTARFFEGEIHFYG